VFQHFITSYGYLAVFVLMLAESACIPIPSEVIMLFGGAAAGGAVAGAHPALAGIVIAGVLGNVVGSYVAWAVGLYAGQPAVRRWGGRFGLRGHDIDRAIQWFDKYGSAAVLIGRVVPVVRTFISLPAGFARMPALRFGLYTTIGCIPWTAALGIAGYAVGANWQHIANAIQKIGYGIAAIVVIAIVVAVVLFFRRRRGRGNGGNGSAPAAREGQAYGTQEPGAYRPGTEASGYPRTPPGDRQYR
jgi:membrane protein DedA with SNARE-associated domain